MILIYTAVFGYFCEVDTHKWYVIRCGSKIMQHKKNMFRKKWTLILKCICYSSMFITQHN